MIANLKERNVLHSVLPNLYANAQKVKAKDVPIGTLVIAKFKDDILPEEPDVYSLLTIYRQTTKMVRCAFYGEDLIFTDDYQLEPDDEVVILTADKG